MVAAAVAQSQALVGGRVASRQQRPRVVRVAALQQGAEPAPAAPLRFLAAGLAAAALATATPAQAGVVLVQPEVKNFVRDTPAQLAAKSAPAKKAAAPKSESGAAPGFGFEAIRPLALPLALLAVGGAGAAAVKADPEFAKLLDESWGAKDSNSTGAGYETALKNGAISAKAAAPKKTVKGTVKKTVKGAGTAKKSILGSVFGSRD